MTPRRSTKPKMSPPPRGTVRVECSIPGCSHFTHAYEDGVNPLPHGWKMGRWGYECNKHPKGKR